MEIKVNERPMRSRFRFRVKGNKKEKEGVGRKEEKQMLKT